MQDITNLQSEIDQFLNGEFDVFTSLCGNGIDLHNRFGYVATYDDAEDLRHEIFKD